MLSLFYGPTLASMCAYWKDDSFDYTDLCQQSNVSAFEYAVWVGCNFSSRSKHLLISWLQSTSAVILEPLKINSTTVAIISPSICHEVMGPESMIPKVEF